MFFSHLRTPWGERFLYRIIRIPTLFYNKFLEPFLFAIFVKYLFYFFIKQRLTFFDQHLSHMQRMWNLSLKYIRSNVK